MKKEMIWRRALVKKLVELLDNSMKFHYNLTCDVSGKVLTVEVDNNYRFWDKAADIVIEAIKPYKEKVNFKPLSLKNSVVITIIG